MSKKKVITISFKNTEEDISLYEAICKKSDKSAYIKDTLREYLEENNKPKQQKTFKKIEF